jgi:hypothetical protein
MGEKKNAYRLLEGRPEGWKPLGRARLDNIRMGLSEMAWSFVDWARSTNEGEEERV